MIFILLSACIASLTLVSLIRFYLNEAKSKLDQIGLPMTLNNVFFLSANEEASARDRARKQAVEDDMLLSREIVRSEFRREFDELVSKGVSRVEAIEQTLDPPGPERARTQARLRAMTERK